MFWCNVCGKHLSGDTDGYAIHLHYGLRYKITRELEMCPECFAKISTLFAEFFQQLDDKEGKPVSTNLIKPIFTKEDYINVCDAWEKR